MGITVGIDLGTTYSAVAMIDQQTGRAHVIPNRDGGSVTPSVVAVMPDGQVLIGDEAKEQQETGYTETAAFFKRAMGDESFTLPLCGRTYSATDLSAMMLRGLVEQAQEVSGSTIDHAIVTVPAYFRNAEREATLEAARLAGLDVYGVLNEPTAAAFAYGLNGSPEPQTILVYDLGGGTFDVTLAHVDGDEIRVLGSDGNHQLGGKDWDDAVVRWVAGKFEDEFDVDITEDDGQLARLAVAAENAKKRLTRSAYADITVDYAGHTAKYRLSRDEFDDITSFMLGETADIVDRLFASVDPPMDWSRVDGAILVGGSTRMPQVHEYIERMSGKKPLGGVNVDEAVALGAAIRANQDTEGHPLFTIGGGTATPTATIGGNAPSDAPRMVLGGKKIVDVCTHALGMIAESKDRTQYVNTVVIPKNTPIPANYMKTLDITVPRSGNGRMEIYMLQGDARAPLDNEIAGKYVFEGIPYVDGGKSNINVAFCYNGSGVIEVYGQQAETGQQFTGVREPLPEDMSWVLRSPLDIERERAELVKQNQVTGEVYLMVDLSGSMSGDPLEKAIQAAHDFVNTIDVSMLSVGVVAFATDVKRISRASHRVTAVHTAIDKLRSQYGKGDVGYGNTPDTLSDLDTYFDDAQSGPNSIKLAIILTDGCWGPEEPSIQDAQWAWEAGIDTIAIGFGGAKEDFLKKISSISDLAGLTDLNHLSETFSNIGREISSGAGLSI
ncbi:Hsp70 family protein [uncultured Bifidobacterium sp.]|uniref:Hsp70 family protein n=1 Tax=uncultured Bifidobacterium sp. TaxID=165187 RepID=UPI0025899E41|nr:Hsp70 family protein [uncultured Bifidobacterium sp.]